MPDDKPLPSGTHAELLAFLRIREAEKKMRTKGYQLARDLGLTRDQAGRIGKTTSVAFRDAVLELIEPAE